MSICDDLARACTELGLAFAWDCDRVQPKFKLTLDGEPGDQVLRFVMRDDHDVRPRLLDLDVARQGLLLEVGVKTVTREPSFDLWLEEVERQRFLVIRNGDAWTLRAVDGVETVGAAVGRIE